MKSSFFVNSFVKKSFINKINNFEKLCHVCIKSRAEFETLRVTLPSGVMNLNHSLVVVIALTAIKLLI